MLAISGWTSTYVLRFNETDSSVEGSKDIELMDILFVVYKSNI